MGIPLRHLCAAAAVITAPLRAPAADFPFRDPSLSFEQRAADLLARLTPEEKCQQLQVHVDTNSRLGIPAIDWWTEANHGISNRGPSGPVTVFPQAIGMAATFDPAIVKQIGDATGTEARARFQPGGVRYRGLVLWAPTL
ncbi:MAG TPA: glycoside hydrolase family 3 N-terminal domain-containing protein, partial [Phycisphaerae bacterium]|nr:glycoside hydrolase family 3 N-terminal domain-containing protein [Phycisphaerae bacterium]